MEYYHFACAGFSTDKEANQHSDTFICKPCKNSTNKQYSEEIRNRHWLQRLVEYEKDYEDTKPNGWFNDNHITYTFEELQKSLSMSSEDNQTFLFIKPSIAHWISTVDSNEKDRESKDHTLSSFDLEKKNIILMPVCKRGNNNKEGGEHWSLLVYKKDINKWYHFDPINTYNDTVARNLANKVNKYLSENIPDFVAAKCTQQNNGYDCGPYVCLFAKKIVEIVKEGLSLTPCWVDKGLIPYTRQKMRKRCAHIIAEHLMKEEGMKIMEGENSDLDIKKYTNDLRISIQESLRREEEKLRDINKANEANKNTNGAAEVVEVEAMDTNPIVTSASSSRSDSPVMSATGEEAMVSDPSVTSASYVVVPPVVPTAVDPTAPTAANTVLDTAVVDSISTQTGEASLRTAPGPVPSDAALGGRSASTETGSDSDSDANPVVVGRGVGGGGGDTEVCRYHIYRKCIRGTECKFRHPITCKNQEMFGECKDRRCNRIHQRVCRHYWNSGRCVRVGCGFIHPRKMRQGPPGNNRNNRNRNGWNGDQNQTWKDQNHTSYGYRHRDRRNSGHNYQSYKSGPSHGPQNFETNFLHHPMMNLEWKMEEMMARLEKLERDRMNQMNVWPKRL